jgi:hypothetical protein
MSTCRFDISRILGNKLGCCIGVGRSKCGYSTAYWPVQMDSNSSCSSLAGCTGNRLAVLQYRLYLPDQSKWTGTALSPCSSLAGCTGTWASAVAVQIIFTWPVQMDRNRLESLFQLGKPYWRADTGQWCCRTPERLVKVNIFVKHF